MGSAQPFNDTLGKIPWAKSRMQKPTDPMKGLLEQQQKQAEDAKTQLALKPKQISPDNFLATKSSQLARLRLGLGSTMTAGGGVPPATLSAPALTGSAPGKTKLGQ